MLAPKSLMLDTNIWIGYLLAEPPHGEVILKLIDSALEHNITLIYAPTTLKDVFFIVPRRMRADDNNEAGKASYAPAAWACIRKITEIAVAAPQALAECELAWMLRNTHGDLEDNLVIAAAETCNADYVVTYDKQMLERFAPACITPEQALKLLEMV